MMLYNKIQKKFFNLINSYVTIRKDLFHYITINLGSTLNSRVKNWYKYLNKRHFIFGNYSSGKIGNAIIDLTGFNSFKEYTETVKGKNSVYYYKTRCEKMKYYFRPIILNDHIDEIFEINTSVNKRQGKKMASKYSIKVDNYEPEELTEYFGVFNIEGKLVSYINLLFVNEAVFIFKLLGHASFLKDNIMYFMIFNAIEQIFKRRENKYPYLKYIIYDSFFTNSKGLAFFKKRFGFSPVVVKWLLD